MMDHYTLEQINVTADLSCRHDELQSGSGSARKAFVKLTKMLVCLVVIVSLMLSMVVPVHAIALTTGIAIATVGALVLAACGVVLTAPTGQSLTDYIGSQIDSYAVSQGYSNRSTWLNGVTQQNVTSTTIWSILDNAVKIPGGIYNALTTWANSFVEDNDIQSGGSAVGQMGSAITINVKNPSGQYASYSGTFTASVTSDNSYDILYNQWKNLSWYNGTVYWDQNAFVIVPMSPGTYDITVSWVQGSNGNVNPGTANYAVNFYKSTSPTSVTSTTVLTNTKISGTGWNGVYRITIPDGYSYLAYCPPISHRGGNPVNIYDGTQSFSFSEADFMTDPGTVITPSANVSVPPDAGLGQDVIIRGLPVSSSMTPEEAADAIQDQATTSAGLTATASLDGDAVPEGSGWLYNAIQAVGEFIVDGIGGLFIPSEGFWDVYVDNISDLFDDRMGLLTYPISVVADLFGRVADLEDVEPVLRWNDVVWKGQVVIPGGSYNLNDILEEDSMETIYGIYRVVVGGIMVIALIHLFIKKLEEIETK